MCPHSTKPLLRLAAAVPRFGKALGSRDSGGTEGGAIGAPMLPAKGDLALSVSPAGYREFICPAVRMSHSPGHVATL